ncbi:MAG: hypothetical protein Pg6C_18250 [Treponemataceae bacterium]|nr:MAG: hypothetical protein Pg6C_18250 [Treponemataceae bacterium]
MSENKKQNPVEPALLNRSESAKFLGVGLNTLGGLGIPKTRIRRRVLYRRDILEKWVKENTEKKTGAGAWMIKGKRRLSKYYSPTRAGCYSGLRPPN